MPRRRRKPSVPPNQRRITDYLVARFEPMSREKIMEVFGRSKRWMECTKAEQKERCHAYRSSHFYLRESSLKMSL